MQTTPDLSQEFHPQPKPLAKGKKPAKPLGVGTKTKQWNVERSQLKDEFEQMGITECELKFEGCWKNTALGFAHTDKRANLTVHDLPGVVLSCQPCHAVVEAWNRIRMKNYLLKVIKERNDRF